MIIFFQIVLIILGVTLVLFGLLWIFIPIFSGLPWIPTHRPRIHKALQLAQLQPGELMVDLGAGDGRVLILAARKFGASALGIELSPTHCLIAWARARFQGVSDRVSIHMGDFYKHDLGKADVVYAYVTSNHAPRLRTYLEDQLSPGSRVVTISADLDGWEPSAFDSEELIFLYHMPPAPGSLSTYLAKRGSD